MSIRLRLTLLYTTILALMLAIGGTALYVTLSRVMLGSIEGALAGDARQLVGAGRFRLDEIDWLARRIGASATLFQTRDLSGAIQDRSPNLGGNELPLSEAGLAAVRDGRFWTEAAVIDSDRLLVHSRALATRGQIVGVIQAARSLDEYDQSLATLRMALFAGGGLGLLVAFGSGWLLAGAALRPIDRVTQTAAAIGAERDFTRRVEYNGPNDEVGRLATTFNAMLTELHAGYRQVAHALQTQRRFVGDASHELRTPLTTIRGNLELLRREPPIDPADRLAVLRDTIDETDRLSRLVGDLLALARADAGWKPALDVVPVAPLVEEVGRQARLLAPDRPIETATGGDLAVTASRDLLKQVLLILVDNALKHTPAAAAVRIVASDDGAQVALTVSDRGPGIPPEALPHLFERFYRADSARTEGGAGLGLAIAQALVETQSGTIGVESREGGGSMFTVRLPQARPLPASGDNEDLEKAYA